MIVVKFDYKAWMDYKYKDKFKLFFRFDFKNKVWFCTKKVPQVILTQLTISNIKYSNLETQIKDIEYSEFLFDFQKKGCQKLLHHYYNGYGGYGIFWSVGVGKTLLSLEFIKQIYNDNNNKFIIMCPAAVKMQYYNEIKKFNYDFDVVFYDGTKKKREKLSNENHKVLISTYDTFRNDILLLKDYNILICDEASKLKTSTTQIHKAIRKHKADFKLLLTGTPVENGLIDVYNLMNILYDGTFMNYHYFHSYFCDMKEIYIGFDKFKGKAKTIMAISKYKNIEEFNSYIQGMSDRCLKSDVRDDMPDVTYVDRYIENTPAQRKALRELVELIKEGLSKDEKQTYIIRAFTLLRLLDNGCKDLSMSDSNNIILLDLEEKGNSNKLKRLIDDIDEIGNQQLIIFSGFSKSVNIIYDFLKSKDYDTIMITGATKNRDQLIEDFKKNKNQILVCSDALSFGISFSAVDILINFDSALSLGRRIQRDGRILRIDSKNNKTIINYVGDIIGKHIKQLIENKEDISNKAIENIINKL